jgi:hypothetical protein
MKNDDITDPVFREAVEAIDAGNATRLQQLLNSRPALVAERLTHPAKGYFARPYLLWFVADNPIRHEKLPSNITAITSLLITTAKEYAVDSFQSQIDYALGLVATGRVPRDCGVQIELMNLLIDAGAKPGNGLGALAHGNIEAAKHLLARGGKPRLATAVGLGMDTEVVQLLPAAGQAELDVALVVASFFGNPGLIRLLIQSGANVNADPIAGDGFHTHATALHQAVYAGSLDAVKMLVAAGANLDTIDKIYGGTPLGWAMHLQTETNDTEAKKNYAAIEAFLRGKPAG